MDAAPRLRRPPSPIRVVRARPRLFLSAVAGLVVIAVSLTVWRPTTCLLLGWDVGVGLYLILASVMMARSDIHRIRRRAALQDEGATVVLVLTVAAAVASVAAIMVELGLAAGHRPFELVVALLTIALSWAFIHTVFALHYAHEYYGDGDGLGGGLGFPGEDPPDYWDFVYFSFVIGMTSQVSDVAVTRRAIRRTATLHGLVAFAFNVTLLALTVNVAASVIQGPAAR